MVILFPTGINLILVTMVLTLASSVPGDSGSTWASPVTVESDPKHGLTSPDVCGAHGTSPDPHVSGLTWASPGVGVFRTPLGSIRIWLHCSLTVTQPDLLTLVFTWAYLDMVTLVPTWVSPGQVESDPHLVLTFNW